MSFAIQAADDAKIETAFSYQDPDANGVALVGEFNNWKPTPMARDGSGVWRITLPLSPGTYGYKFLINGSIWQFDSVNPSRKMVDHSDNSAVTVGSGVAPAGHSSMAPENGTFKYTNATAQSVFVAGDFNKWSATATPMTKGESGTWSAAIPLSPGEHPYKYVVDGRWILDPENPKRADDGTGVKNSILTVPGFVLTSEKAWSSEANLRDGYKRRFYALLQQKNFKELEDTARELRTTKARFSDGRWKLAAFYDGIEAGGSDAALYQQFFSLYDEWIKAFPSSLTARVAKAGTLTAYAWQARGGGWAKTVKESEWKLFEERLDQARRTLEEAESLKEKCPGWYAEFQTVALGQGWHRDEYESFYKKAVAFESGYYDFYFRKAHFLLPRWYGADGEWERFADEAANKDDPSEGSQLYARIAWSNSGFYKNLFRETNISWERMKDGFLQMQKAYPTSRWNLNAFCRFAVMAEDRETAKALLAQIGDEPDITAWGTPGNWYNALRWIKNRSDSAARKTFSVNGQVETLTFAPDGKKLVAGTDAGTVMVWDPATEEKISRKNFTDRVAAVNVSPDGKYLAVGAGSEWQQKPGLVRIFALPGWEEKATVRGWEGGVARVEFTPDSKKLIMAGGVIDRIGEIRVWDAETGRTEAFAGDSKHSQFVRATAISPDGTKLVFDQGPSIEVWDLANRKLLQKLDQQIGGWILHFAFSPDGKTLLETTGSGWASHGQDGRIFFWDTASWKSREQGSKTRTTGIVRAYFSTDGKMLVGCGLDNCVRLWLATDGSEVATLYGHTDAVADVAISRDGKTIASGSHDQTVKVWDTPVLPQKPNE